MKVSQDPAEVFRPDLNHSFCFMNCGRQFPGCPDDGNRRLHSRGEIGEPWLSQGQVFLFFFFFFFGYKNINVLHVSTHCVCVCVCVYIPDLCPLRGSRSSNDSPRTQVLVFSILFFTKRNLGENLDSRAGKGAE